MWTMTEMQRKGLREWAVIVVPILVTIISCAWYMGGVMATQNAKIQQLEENAVQQNKVRSDLYQKLDSVQNSLTIIQQGLHDFSESLGRDGYFPAPQSQTVKPKISSSDPSTWVYANREDAPQDAGLPSSYESR